MEREVAVVTGGSAGIGAAICNSLLERGMEVISLARRSPEFSHPRLQTRSVDLLDRGAVREVARDVADTYPVSHFVHNAGVIRPNLIEQVSDEDMDALSQLHLTSALTLTQAFIPSMKKNKYGRIVLISSRGALGLQTRTAYAATKAGMIGMGRTWALELAGFGITVNVVAPGPIASDMFYDVIEPGSEREKSLAAAIPVGRIGMPDDVAQAVAFFCSAASGFVTGQVLYVCGGSSIGSITI
ncbi:MAG: SDR family NAD(P)-dependent oxidoreductase [Advenella sp.]|uniref:Short-chain dehydrogenase n=1 Tax=Advenella kashmirensis TaxID=310575 RepID=A0A356LDD1_9BURK|nr:SDR family oxidoreductase [Advenella sp. FME57]HBP28952.1 short-chain dehydrogenase [Advenella kashmirensis]